MSQAYLRRTCQRAGTAFALTLAAITLMSVSASATDGSTAVGMCIDSTAAGARCEWSVNDKGEIDICNKNGCVYCPSATGECSVASRSRPRPKTWLPEGTKVSTAVGEFVVKPHAITGPLLGAAPKKGATPNMKKQ